jgi:hypothetical protein
MKKNRKFCNKLDLSCFLLMKSVQALLYKDNTQGDKSVHIYFKLNQSFSLVKNNENLVEFITFKTVTHLNLTKLYINREGK